MQYEISTDYFPQLQTQTRPVLVPDVLCLLLTDLRPVFIALTRYYAMLFLGWLFYGSLHLYIKQIIGFVRYLMITEIYVHLSYSKTKKVHIDSRKRLAHILLLHNSVMASVYVEEYFTMSHSMYYLAVKYIWLKLAWHSGCT